MNSFFANLWANWVKAPFFSSRGMFARSLGLVIFFFALHAVGLREYTSFISGTTPTGDPSHIWIDLAGITYFSAYSLALLIAPVFMLAAVILKATNHWWPPANSHVQPTDVT